ncbi:ABC transporter ATP-binding protein [Labrys wisconsinensis]|uniref:NitT/TauT family transport system ATP-binding protein n=1 Tax=Labrys wisconsinensis TaxID=425677 RepID=A0ABU0J9G1_9HYPH|nr:ABC transporter ATP-binding protein [Labrys wisconsinensis]MDQ0470899.1 NitT/TauT family transport system ATP-binding protein [Labrys wisconsinensis]
MAVILSARAVSKRYDGRRGDGVLALDTVSLEVRQGEFLCLLGASGCGKSTLLNMFAGFVAPTGGEIRLREERIEAIEPRCGMVFQSYALFPWKTVRENVGFGPKMRGCGRAERRDIAERFLAMVGLSGFAEHYPAELSGGMQQRVTLARCLAADPEVMLMDEPFAALDAMTREVLQGELMRIQRQSGKTVVFVTHNIDEALVMADRIVVMSPRPGRIAALIDNDLPRPRDIEVQLLPAYAGLKRRVWSLVAGDLAAHAA